MSKIREKQLQRRKQEALEVAMRLLYERGYASLNMDELAEEAGISKPTLYQYFNSKDELVAQVMMRMYEKMGEELDALAHQPPLAQLEHFLRLLLKSRSEKRHVMAQMDAEIRRTLIQRYPYLREHQQAMRSNMSQIVKKAQEQGDIDPTLPTWVVVNAMFAMPWVISNPYAKEEPQRTDEEMAEAIESVVHLFKRGIGMGVAEYPVESLMLD